MTNATRRITGGVLSRWASLPKPVKRWHAVVNGVMLAASAGVALTVSVIALWRLVDWLGWAWNGASHLVGPQAPFVWRLAERPLNILFDVPGQPQDGVVIVVAQFYKPRTGAVMLIGQAALIGLDGAHGRPDLESERGRACTVARNVKGHPVEGGPRKAIKMVRHHPPGFGNSRGIARAIGLAVRRKKPHYPGCLQILERQPDLAVLPTNADMAIDPC